MIQSNDNCGFADVIRMVEGKWKVDILWELGAGKRRFGRLRQAIPDISEKMLAQQLRELEADGLVDRVVHPGPALKVVYSLTPRGAALNAAAAAFCESCEQHRQRNSARAEASGTVDAHA